MTTIDIYETVTSVDQSIWQVRLRAVLLGGNQLAHQTAKRQK